MTHEAPDPVGYREFGSSHHVSCLDDGRPPSTVYTYTQGGLKGDGKSVPRIFWLDVVGGGGRQRVPGYLRPRLAQSSKCKFNPGSFALHRLID